MKRLHLTLLVLVIPILSWAQEFRAEDYVITKYSMDEGLPQNSINAIEQSSDGYIWIATFSGLVRFDGHSFKTFNRANTPCLVSDDFLKIHITRDNYVWLFPSGINTAIIRFKDGSCNSYKVRDGISRSITFLEDYDGTPWLIDEGRPLKFNGIEFQEVRPVYEEEFKQKAIESEKGSWFGIDNKLYRLYNGLPVLVLDELPGEKSSFVYAKTNPLKENTLLVGTSVGIIEYEYGNEFKETKRFPLPYENFLNLKFDNEGNQFVITANGIAYKEKDVFEPLNPFQNLTDVRLKSIIQDNEGNYWIGTGGDGLFRFKKKFISMIDSDQGLFNEKILSITKLDNGKMLFSTNCSDLYEWYNGEAKISPLQENLQSNCFWSVFQDSKGRIWFGSGEPHLMLNYGKPSVKFGKEQGFDSYAVFAITEDQNGYIWIATSQGIYLYDGTTLIRKITEADGLYYNDSRVMFEDKDGTMWVGTNAGLHTIKNYKVTRIPLLTESQTEFETQPYIRAIHKDEDGVFWIGTYGDGLFRIKNEEVIQFTTKHGLFDNTASHIIEDDDGFFWMGTNRGIQRVSRNQLNAVAEGNLSEVVSYSYGSSDGMNSPETNGGFQPSYIVEENGDIYLPTVAGVAKVSVTNARINHNPPPVYIETVRNSEAEELNAEELRLSHEQAFLEINYTAINFSDPGKVRFKYRLLGLKDEWVDAGSRREAVYTKIPPGDYTFQVIAANNDGFWNDEGASLAISIVPPYWQQLWFILLSVTTIFGGIGFLFWQRTRRMKEESERQQRFTERLIESQENERRRIAMELHDGLGQQILVIKNRVELAKLKFRENPELSEQLQEIEHSALRSIEDVRTISHDLRPVLLEKFGLTDAVVNLCEQMEKGSSLDWSYHVGNLDNIFPKNKEINFYRILQEACNNILKHSNASQASLIIKSIGSGIHITIYDDGDGFDLKKLNFDMNTGLGLTGIKERVQTLKGKLTIQAEEQKGTVIKIQIPTVGHAE